MIPLEAQAKLQPLPKPHPQKHRQKRLLKPLLPKRHRQKHPQKLHRQQKLRPVKPPLLKPHPQKPRPVKPQQKPRPLNNSLLTMDMSRVKLLLAKPPLPKHKNLPPQVR